MGGYIFIYPSLHTHYLFFRGGRVGRRMDGFAVAEWPPVSSHDGGFFGGGLSFWLAFHFGWCWLDEAGEAAVCGASAGASMHGRILPPMRWVEGVELMGSERRGGDGGGGSFCHYWVLGTRRGLPRGGFVLCNCVQTTHLLLLLLDRKLTQRLQA
jgi:hypothetical protein